MRLFSDPVLAHDIFDATDPCVSKPCRGVEFLAGPVQPQCLQHHVHAYLVSELEAVGKGLFRAEDSDFHAVDLMHFEAFRHRNSRKTVRGYRGIVHSTGSSQFCMRNPFRFKDDLLCGKYVQTGKYGWGM